MKIDTLINSNPIANNYDLWCALDAAEVGINSVILETSRKDIREAQREASSAIFANLKKLVMDYVQVKL